jgi:hypothetical protein
MLARLLGSEEEKGCMTLTPGVNVIIRFFFVAEDKAKLDRVFVPGNHFPVKSNIGW